MPNDDGRGNITHGLLVRKEPLERILAGTKTWEVRDAATDRRGRIALLDSGSGQVLGTCLLSDVVGPLRVADLEFGPGQVTRQPEPLRYATAYAWVLSDARRLHGPIHYRVPHGAVVWVELDRPLRQQLLQAS